MEEELDREDSIKNGNRHPGRLSVWSWYTNGDKADKRWREH
jgi:hypothetical protein